MFYRMYDRAWNRIGYRRQPQYPGQAGMTHDFAEPVVAIRAFGRVGVTKDGREIRPTPITQAAGEAA